MEENYNQNYDSCVKAIDKLEVTKPRRKLGNGSGTTHPLLLFMKDKRHDWNEATNYEFSHREMTSLLVTEWKEMTEAEREPWVKMSKEL